MYYGKITDELKLLLSEYEKKFGYNPNGDMELEITSSDYDEYVEALKKSVKTGRDIYTTLDGANYL